MAFFSRFADILFKPVLLTRKWIAQKAAEALGPLVEIMESKNEEGQ